MSKNKKNRTTETITAADVATVRAEDLVGPGETFQGVELKSEHTEEATDNYVEGVEKMAEPVTGTFSAEAPTTQAKPKETKSQEAIRKSRNTPADIHAVMELRLAGATYMQIEDAMGWPDQHGNRAYRICKDLGIAGGRRKKPLPVAPAAPNAFEGLVPSDADLAAARTAEAPNPDGGQ